MPLEQFVHGVLVELGAQVTPDDGGLRVELDVAQWQELEGRPWWTAMAWGSGGEQRVVLQFVFDAEHLAKDPRAELVTTGSARLDQLVGAALRAGRLGRAWIEVSGVRPVAFRPYLVFHFLLTYVGHEPRDRLASIAVDLVTGEGFPWHAGEGPWRPLPTRDGTPAEVPQLSVGEAHQRAVDVLAHLVEVEDEAWLQAARAWLEQELEALSAYIGAGGDEDPEMDAARARLDELKVLARPHVRARAEAATLLYMPIVPGEDGSGHLKNAFLDRVVQAAPSRAEASRGVSPQRKR